MAAPNKATITASLERSLEKFSLNRKSYANSGDETSNDVGLERSVSTSSSPDGRDQNNLPNNDTTLELNSHVSLPYYWEQCLDLKGIGLVGVAFFHSLMAALEKLTLCGIRQKQKGFPKQNRTGEIYYINWRNGMKAKEDPRTTAEYNGYYYSEEEEEDEDVDDDSLYDSEESSSSRQSTREANRGVEKNNVLVVGGCKICFMYFMVPKHVHDCPKCNGQLLHFDRSGNCSL